MWYKMRKSVEILNISPTELRKMQMIMLEILIEFDRVCRKHKINYSLGGGTMLGAVRHKGFIPWDGDADVFMLRDEYDKFRKICEHELDDNRFFLQDYKSDKYYRWGYARILRNETELVRAGYEHMKSRNGVFIDVLVFDNVPDNYFARRIHIFLCYCLRKTLWSEAGKKVHPYRMLRMFYQLLSLIPKNFAFYIRNIILKKCNSKDTKLVRHMTSVHINKQKYGIPRKYFDELIDYSFEGYSFLGFKEYDSYLKSAYGDYMTLPDEADRNSHVPCSKYSLVEPNLN